MGKAVTRKNTASTQRPNKNLPGQNAKKQDSSIALYAKDLTDDVALKRRYDLKENFPKLHTDQYISEQEYRQALIGQYRQLREEEYKNTCLVAGIEAYDIASQLGGGTSMNTIIWDGGISKGRKVQDANGNLILPRDSTAYCMYQEVLPTYTRGYSNHKKVVKTKKGTKVKYGEFCCSASVCTIEAGICKEMKLEGLIKNDPLNTGAANLAPFDKNHRLSGKGGQALWQQISDGKVGPGDFISQASSGNSVSGRHAMMVVAVNSDKDGKLLSYVVQGNNNANLLVVSSPNDYPPLQTIKDKKTGKAIKVPGTYEIGCMNKWIDEQLSKEAQNMKSLSTKELEEMVDTQKSVVIGTITQLELQEHHLFSTQGLDSKVQKYADWYIKNADVPEATKAVMKADKANALTASAQVQNNDAIDKKKNLEVAPKLDGIQIALQKAYTEKLVR